MNNEKRIQQNFSLFKKNFLLSLFYSKQTFNCPGFLISDFLIFHLIVYTRTLIVVECLERKALPYDFPVHMYLFVSPSRRR
jgi:hypothetical protein